MNIIELLMRVDIEHKIRFTGIYSNFRKDFHYPIPLEFRLGQSEYDISTRRESLSLIEINDQQLHSRSLLLRYFTENRPSTSDTFKFFFRGIEVVMPELGDISYSDKVTQIYFKSRLL